jgi:hypothetical protein
MPEQLPYSFAVIDDGESWRALYARILSQAIKKGLLPQGEVQVYQTHDEAFKPISNNPPSLTIIDEQTSSTQHTWYEIARLVQNHRGMAVVVSGSLTKDEFLEKLGEGEIEQGSSDTMPYILFKPAMQSELTSNQKETTGIFLISKDDFKGFAFLSLAQLHFTRLSANK